MKSDKPKECNLQDLLAIEKLAQKDMEKNLSQVFALIEKRMALGYESKQDKLIYQLIKNTLTYVEAVQYSHDKMIDDLRFAWDSYWISEKQAREQFESFRTWYTKNKANGN